MLDRVDQALEMLNAPEPAAEAAPAAPGGEPAKPAPITGGAAPAEGAAAQAAPAAEPAKPGEAAKPAEPAGEADDKLAFKDHPRFQELLKKEELAGRLHTEVNEILQAAHVEKVGDLKGTVEDALMLYDVLDAKMPARQLLEAVRANYQPEVFQKIVADLKDYLGKIEGGAPAAGAEGKTNGAGKADPLARDVEDLKSKFTEREQREQQAEIKRVGDSFVAKVEELGKPEGLDADDLKAYASVIAGKINGNPEILKRIAAGKFGDVERLFTEHHNLQVKRLEERSKALIDAKTKRQQGAPNIPMGGAPPAPTEPVKRSLKTSDERIAAATDAWNAAE